MTIQDSYNRIIDLLSNHRNTPFVEEVLSTIESGEYTYHSVDYGESNGNIIGQNISEIVAFQKGKYEYQSERNEGPYVEGFEYLLQALENTTIERVIVSNIRTIFGTYLIFSDSFKIILFGILKSKSSLSSKKPDISKEILEEIHNSEQYKNRMKRHFFNKGKYVESR